MSSIPRSVITETVREMTQFAANWHEEIPVRIHSRSVSDGGTPEWHAEFAQWLGRADQFNDKRWRENPEPRLRTTRAFRKLRRAAVREYEVVYRTAILRIPFPETVAWLNERAIRNQKTDRYTEDDALMLLISGVDKIASWIGS
jgi:hypothetical protein